jgi:N-acetylglucosaminyldiphosphoundecaprenol N-acetyl-beta-D-mannosaminyltransferase
LIVAGQRNGYFTVEQLPDIIRDMRSSQARILLVGISSPTKEYWLKENMSKIDIPFCMGVGGSFDVAAGEAKRAPLIMQKMGMEWFYRFIQEPGRLWERYLIGNMSFILYFISCKLRGLQRGGNHKTQHRFNGKRYSRPSH